MIRIFILALILMTAVDVNAQMPLYDPPSNKREARNNQEMRRADQRLIDLEDQKHIGTKPSISSCGATPAPLLTEGSTDIAGKFTAGGGAVISCTLTFEKEWQDSPSPICICQNDTDKDYLYCVATTTTLTVGDTSTDFNEDVISYSCSPTK